MKQASFKFFTIVILVLSFFGLSKDSQAKEFLAFPLEVVIAPSYTFDQHDHVPNARGNDYPVKVGTYIIASHDGKAKVFNNGIPNTGGTTGGYGNYAIIYFEDNGHKWEIVYGHLTVDSFLIKTDDYVRQGQVLAKSGNSGWSTGPHLHFEVRKDNVSVDPYDLNNYLWTTNPPSVAFFRNEPYFDFANHSQQGFSLGFDTEYVPQNQYDRDTWMIAAIGYNPGIVSPSLPVGIDTGQFKKLRISARVDGGGQDCVGKIWIKNENGNWNHQAVFSQLVKRDYDYHVYDVNLTRAGTNLKINQFSVELTEDGGYEHWMFDWIRLYSSYYQWDFSDSQLGWSIRNGANKGFENSLGEKYFWEIDPAQDDPGIISPYLDNIQAEDYDVLKIRIAVNKCKAGKNKALVYFETDGDKNFSVAKSVVFTQDIICDKKQREYTAELYKNSNYQGKIQRIRIDFLAEGCADDSDNIRVDYIKFAQANFSGGDVIDEDTDVDFNTAGNSDNLTNNNNTTNNDSNTGGNSSIPTTTPVQIFTYTGTKIGNSHKDGIVKWSWEIVGEKTVFNEGEPVTVFSELKDVNKNISLRSEIYLKGVFLWDLNYTYEINPQAPWEYLYFTSIDKITILPAGAYEVKIFQDSGEGFQLLDTKIFTIVRTSPDYKYIRSVMCEKTEKGAIEWTIQTVGEKNVFNKGEQQQGFVGLQDVYTDVRFKVEVYFEGNYSWEYETSWYGIDTKWGWKYVYFTPLQNSNVPAGKYEFKIFLDTGNGFQSLSTMAFTINFASQKYNYINSTTCENIVDGEEQWTKKALNPKTTFSTNERIYEFVELQNVFVDVRFKIETYYNNIYSWKYETPWYGIDTKWGWEYVYFTAYQEKNAPIGDYEFRIFLDAGNGFEFLTTNFFKIK